MQYRRAYVPGGCYFFTVVTANRRPIFTDQATVRVLRQAFRHVMKKRPFVLNAMVVLPDHLHCVWTLPNEDSDYSLRWRLIKTWFTKHCDNRLKIQPDSSRSRKGEQFIWQHRFWEHVLRDEADFKIHIDYIHYNPVKHGYTQRPGDWRYTSFLKYVDAGVYSLDWGSTTKKFLKGVGGE